MRIPPNLQLTFAFTTLGLGLLVVACGSDNGPRGVRTGEELFALEFTPDQGLGPLFNGRACASCHAQPTPGGMGPNGLSVVFRVGVGQGAGFDALVGRGGPVARNHSVAELGYSCSIVPGLPAIATVISTRNTPSLYGLGDIARIPDQVIAAGAQALPQAGIAGRLNWVVENGEQRLGRFGWKAHSSDLQRFVADALRSELGVTNPVFPEDLVTPGAASGCAGFSSEIEADASTVTRLADFVASLPAVTPPSATDERGRELFAGIGCAGCHTPALAGAEAPVQLYSDLLLHDMGNALADGFVQGSAQSGDWRTTPLWGLRFRQRFLHDGRGETIPEAIAAHEGEATQAVAAFNALDSGERDHLLAFLSDL